MRKQQAHWQLIEVSRKNFKEIGSGLVGNAHIAYSKAGIKEDRGEFSVAGTDHVAVSPLFAFRSAVGKLTNGVDKGATNTWENDDILIWVLVIGEGSELRCQRASIAKSVDDVGSLSETNGGNVELGGVLGQPNLPRVHDWKSIADSLGKARSAILVEARGEAIDDSNQKGLIVSRVVSDEIRSRLRGNVRLTKFRRLSSMVSKVGSSLRSVVSSLCGDSLDVDASL